MVRTPSGPPRFVSGKSPTRASPRRGAIQYLERMSHEHGPHDHAMHAEHAEHATHDKHAGHSVAMFRNKFWITLVLTLPTLVWGHMLQQAFGFAAPHFAGSVWVAPVFGTAVFVYGGR